MPKTNMAKDVESFTFSEATLKESIVHQAA